MILYVFLYACVHLILGIKRSTDAQLFTGCCLTGAILFSEIFSWGCISTTCNLVLWDRLLRLYIHNMMQSCSLRSSPEAMYIHNMHKRPGLTQIAKRVIVCTQQYCFILAWPFADRRRPVCYPDSAGPCLEILFDTNPAQLWLYL